MSAEFLPDEAFAAALAGLPSLPPVRMAALLARFGPRGAWGALTSGAAAVVGEFATTARRQAWAAHARRWPPERVWTRCGAAGVAVHVLGGSTYPAELAADHEAPAVLFTRGSLGALDGPRVAIVGTRNATATGREIAAELGEALAGAGVGVVSGLARGIDGWAHRGALRADGAPPLGVVACGLDVPYPHEHRPLWETVAGRGLLLAEVPPGTAPVAYRFPLRNRILAALADVVVVVESRLTGGSLITAVAAGERGIPVLAVPGSPRNPAAAGTNQLLVDGCPPVTDATDVFVALGLARPAPVRGPVDRRPAPSEDDVAVLALFTGEPLDLERVATRVPCSPASAALALGRLEAAGWLARTGGWWERAGTGRPR